MSSQNTDSLRQTLLKTDSTAVAIQASAGAMMKFYSTSPQIAVSEWRNVLISGRMSSPISLLYVANEVLQISKRNRGPKFLEAFSPILESSLRWICSNSSPEIVEKVRRTTKIWGDRRIFSIRFISALVQSLEEYRHKKDNKTNSNIANTNFNHDDNPKNANNIKTKSPTSHETSIPRTQSPREDDNDLHHDDDDDDNSPFVSKGPSLLDVKIDRHALQNPQQLQQLANSSFQNNSSSASSSRIPSKKRRRSSLLNDQKKTKPKQEKKNTAPLVLSTSYMSKLLSRLESLENDFRQVQQSATKYRDFQSLDLSSKYGEELITLNKDIVKAMKHVEHHDRALIHKVAQDRRFVEGQLKRFIPWLDHAVEHDSKDALELCEFVEEKLLLLQVIHGTYGTISHHYDSHFSINIYVFLNYERELTFLI